MVTSELGVDLCPQGLFPTGPLPTRDFAHHNFTGEELCTK